MAVAMKRGAHLAPERAGVVVKRGRQRDVVPHGAHLWDFEEESRHAGVLL
jgi:hypothetical protein